jgi:hypothetical protein
MSLSIDRHFSYPEDGNPSPNAEPEDDPAPCLFVPFNTPASAFYSQDNSPCRSEAANRFAMVSLEDLLCRA